MKQKNIPNNSTMASPIEAIDDMHDPHLPHATTFKELEKILNN